MKYTLILIFSIIFLTGCTPEIKQPELTKSEKVYFQKLQMICECEINRGLIPKYKNIHKKNTYAISLIGIDESKMKNEDSLKKEGFEIAKHLYNHILKKPSFDEIVIFYFGENVEENKTSEVFTYQIETLKQ